MRIQHQHIRVFLEGVEFKSVNTVSINEQIGIPPSCELTTNYISRIQNLLPKTKCHIFYKHEQKYVLIFEGELTSLSFEKNAVQKICKLQFTGLTLNWRNHYLLARDSGLRHFDRGAFLVLNAELPFTYDDEVKRYQAAPAGSWVDWFKSLSTKSPRVDFVKILETNAPNFRKDAFFALAFREADKALHFAKNDATARTRLPSTTTTQLATLEEKPTGTIEAALKQHFYPELAINKRDQSLYGETAWGILQVMGFEFYHLNDDFERALLVNGILYPERCKSLPTNNDIVVNNPQFGMDYAFFKDLNSEEYYPIPNETFLFALQCKVAYNLLVLKTTQLGYSVENGDYWKKVNPKLAFASWLGKLNYKDAHGTSPAVYMDEVYQYFKEANEYFFASSDNSINAPIPFVGDIYADTPVAEVRYNDKALQRGEKYQEWLKVILEGGQIAFSIQNILGSFINSTSLPTLVSGILDGLALTSSYYSTLATGLKFGPNRVSIVDNEPARNLFKINSFTSYLINKAIHRPEGIISGMDLMKVIFDTLNYELFEYAAPVSAGLTNVVLTPDTTFMTPILSNVFFSDQLNDFQFTHSMEAEPTRYVAYSNSMSILTNTESNSAIDLRFGYVTPRIPNTNQDTSFIRGTNGIRQYTYEECWRGVHAQQGMSNDSPFEDMIFQIFQNENEPASVDKIDEKLQTSIASGFLSTYWTSMIDGTFLKRRYGTRNAVLSAVYNPNRICGFPAIIIDNELPAVIGKITGITTTISANGQTMSQIMLSTCHTHWDQDLETVNSFEFSTTPTASGYYNYMKDALPPMDHIWKFLWDPDGDAKYRWFNLGKKIYSPMLGLPETTDSSILQFAEDSYLREADRQNAKVIDWEDYAKAIANSIKNMRRLYKSFENKSSFTDKVIARNLITMDDYWRILTGDKTITSQAYHSALELQDMQINGNFTVDKFINRPFSLERQAKILELTQNSITL
ncbi:MAG: hypothetical protein ACP5N7_03545 [Candidatus Pacearchaeota archaeon]